MELPPGTKINRFQIIQQLGQGGMGDVYLALDTELQREVALKLINHTHSSNRVANYLFGAEARIAAGFSHPHSVVIHEIGRFGDRPYIAMEYVSGKSVQQLIQDGGLSLKESLQVTMQIAECLASAHSQNIVHGDISAANVMLSEDGQAKLLDFGVSGMSGTNSPTEVVSLGNPAYIAPECVHGAFISPATDLFSLGVLFYYMLTNQLPFQGRYEAALLHAIANDEPAPPSNVNERIPTALNDVALKLLQKDPELRYKSAPDLLLDLQSLIDEKPSDARALLTRHARWIVPTAAVAIVALSAAWLGFWSLGGSGTEEVSAQSTIAVLPFENLGDPDKTYFTQGITQEITERLSRVAQLRVISGRSARQYEGSAKGISQIASELNCNLVVTGVVRWDGYADSQRIKVSAELINAKDAVYLWSHSYQTAVDLQSILEIQNAIAREVTVRLTHEISERLPTQVSSNPTTELSAYDFYLRGNHFFYHSWSQADQLNANQMYQRAVELDSGFALAYAKLARSHASIFWDYIDRSETRTEAAWRAVTTALELEPNLSEAQIALGYYYYQCEQDYEKALNQFTDALKYSPPNAELYNAIAAVQRRFGQLDSAVVNFGRSYRLDPRSHQAAFDLGLTYSLLRQYKQAEIYLDQSVLLSPDFDIAHIYKAWLNIFRNGDIARARDIISQAKEVTDLSTSRYYWWLSRILSDNYHTALNDARLSSDSAAYYLHKAQLSRLAGDTGAVALFADSALTVSQRQVDRRPDDPRFLSELGLAYAALGRRDDALRYTSEAMKLLPTSRDAFDAIFLALNYAEALTLFGEYDEAIGQLEYLLSIPGFVSEPYLRLDPLWKPLRQRPRFQALLEKARVD